MYRFWTTVFLLAAPSLPALAASPDPRSLVIPNEDLTRARELVRKLGSEQYAEREQAEQELARMGRLARPALLEAANTDPSQEIRTRVASLLPKATALDFKARLDVFVADTEGKYEHDLPGWNEFRSVVRDEWTLFGHTFVVNRSLDRAARNVFADLLTSLPNRQIVLAAGSGSTDLGALSAARRQELYLQKYPRTVVIGGRLVRPSTIRRDPTAEDIASLLFAESLAPSKSAPRTYPMSSLIASSVFMTAAKADDERGQVYRALTTAWLDSRQDPVEMYSCMSVASSIGLTEHACRIGVRLLTTPGIIGSYRGMAATNLAQFGNKSHLPLLEKALADDTVAYTIRRRDPARPNELPDVQVRDMALAVSVIISGQKLEDYGFVDAYRTSGGIAGGTYTYSRYYIPEDKRKAMHEKWKDWRAKNR